MSEESQGQPFHESNLDSAEYRERLMRKLNTLIAVLEVANAKVRRSLAGPAPDVDRLTRIKKNLADTLEVCLRAKAALERRGSLPQGLSADLARAVNPDLLDAAKLADPSRDLLPRPPRGQEVEMSSPDETRRFEALGRIERAELDQVDLDELARRLQG
ncbi:MAG TPA: hypothetical protein VMT18_13405 [Planctomycetota bacterium]|nr:hypothetical protein [Planctomycetota bacterium]